MFNIDSKDSKEVIKILINNINHMLLALSCSTVSWSVFIY